ncbi:MAG: glycoside hydrolase family 3 N-terminal domain-containing protein [Enterocloster clostridioformis]
MCGHNGYLLDQVLKEEWGFDGFVMSDFVWGVKDTAAAANGGQTMEMCVTKYFGQNLVNAVKEGLVDASRINDAAPAYRAHTSGI